MSPFSSKVTKTVFEKYSKKLPIQIFGRESKFKIAQSGNTG